MQSILRTIYVPNPFFFRRTIVITNGKRKRRNTVSSGSYSGQSATKERILEVVMVNENRTYYTFTLDKLRHFSMYSVSVQACRDIIDPIFNDTTHCGNAVVLNRRTAKIGCFR